MTAATIAVGVLGVATFSSSLIGGTFLGAPSQLVIFFAVIGLVLMGPILPSRIRESIKKFLRSVWNALGE